MNNILCYNELNEVVVIFFPDLTRVRNLTNDVERKYNMKKIVLIILNALLVIPFLIFFRRGANVSIFMLPIWFIATIINAILSKDLKELWMFNGILAMFAIIGIFTNGQLYFKYVYWDTEGELVVMAEIFIGLIYITVLTGIECLIKYLINKCKRK